MNVNIQAGGCDCGLFAIANATALAFGHSPGSFQYNQHKMRQYAFKSNELPINCCAPDSIVSIDTYPAHCLCMQNARDWQLWKTGWNAANAKNGIITTPACVNVRAAALTKSAVWHCMQCLELRKPSIIYEHSHASNTNLCASIILFPDRTSVHYT